jgi:hypothetical protein
MFPIIVTSLLKTGEGRTKIIYPLRLLALLLLVTVFSFLWVGGKLFKSEKIDKALSQTTIFGEGYAKASNGSAAAGATGCTTCYTCTASGGSGATGSGSSGAGAGSGSAAAGATGCTACYTCTASGGSGATGSGSSGAGAGTTGEPDVPRPYYVPEGAQVTPDGRWYILIDVPDSVNPDYDVELWVVPPDSGATSACFKALVPKDGAGATGSSSGSTTTGCVTCSCSCSCNCTPPSVDVQVE